MHRYLFGFYGYLERKLWAISVLNSIIQAYFFNHSGLFLQKLQKSGSKNIPDT
jgi:hypothetical protein